MGFIIGILVVLAVLFLVVLVFAMALGVVVILGLIGIAGITGYAIAMSITQDALMGLVGGGIAIFLVLAEFGYLGMRDERNSKSRT